MYTVLMGIHPFRSNNTYNLLYIEMGELSILFRGFVKAFLSTSQKPRARRGVYYCFLGLVTIKAFTRSQSFSNSG